MSRQDRQAARTPADLERRYNFGRSFAELRNIALDAQTHVYTLEETVKKWSQSVGSSLEGVYAKLEMKIDYDENDQIVSMLNASADVITLNANRLVVNSDNFSLTENGTITAKLGVLGGWIIGADGLSKETTTFEDNVVITNTTKILPDTILCKEYKGITGSFFYFDKQVEISDGGIHITRSGTGTVVDTVFGTSDIPFMDVTLNGTQYLLYIDTATFSVKASPVD